MEQLTVCGVGLMGGSLALAVKERGLARRVVGVDLWDHALPTGVVDEAVSARDAAATQRAIEGAELTVLAMPVGVIRSVLPAALTAAAATGGVVTDCGSTKRALTQSVHAHPGRARFVAGHPMAGHPEGGLGNARSDLFVGRRWLLCPEGISAPDALERVVSLVRAVGAEPVLLGAEEHDRSVALTSHLPQLLASTLAVLVAEAGADAAAGPAFASATRVAGGAEAMWRDIFTSNADAVADALRRLGARLDEVARALEQGPPDAEVALRLLAQARALRAR
jgi:prephenate dehydrogenase